MALFSDPKFLRGLEKVQGQLGRVAAYCTSVELDSSLVEMAHADLTRLLIKIGRGAVDEDQSSKTVRGNMVRSLLQAVSIYTKDSTLFEGTIGRLRQISEASIELANRILIDDATVMDVEGMSSEWQKTSRGNFYRRHEFGFELLVEVSSTGVIGCVSEVALLSGGDAEQMKNQLEAFVEKHFQPAIEHQRAVSLMMAM